MVGMDYGAQECVTGLENMLWGLKTVDYDAKRVQTCSNVHKWSTVFGNTSNAWQSPKTVKKDQYCDEVCKEDKNG